MIEVSARATPTEFDAAFDRWLLLEHPGGPSGSVRWSLHDSAVIDPSQNVRDLVRHGTAQARLVAAQIEATRASTAASLAATLEPIRKTIDELRMRQYMSDHELARTREHGASSRRAVFFLGLACLVIALTLAVVYVRF